MNRQATGERLVILGAGPAGAGAAYYAAGTGLADVTVLERGKTFGGNAGSFELDGLRVDYGSHRLHPASDPEILADIKHLLGEELLDRPRHGRIRLLGRWIHFPLKPLDLAFRLPPAFFPGVAWDTVTRPLRKTRNSRGAESFASILRAKLGPTIARDFYLPYAVKLWGVDPEDLSPIQARRRVSADSPLKLVRKVLKAVPGLKPAGSGRFFYPKRGFGQITEAIAGAAAERGATIRLGAKVTGIEIEQDGPLRVAFEEQGQERTIVADRIWSTIPITVLVRSLRPAPPEPVLQAAAEIRFRSMILVYLVLGQDRFTEYDAHYFPGTDVRITRLSEPKNYAAAREPAGRTVLCAELPCFTSDPEWSLDDEELGRLVVDALRRAALPVTAPLLRVVSRRLPQAYPVYLTGYERAFEVMDDHVNALPGILTFGRQGLFAHDNTHHALFMARAASRCLDGKIGFDRARWGAFRRIFETHVVED